MDNLNNTDKSSTGSDIDKSNRLIWLDCETTGLDKDKDLLLQVAVVVTDENLVPVHEGLEITLWQNSLGMAGLMDEYVTKLHTDSGLLKEVADSRYSIAVAENKLLAYLAEYALPDTSPMCGNNVGFDRGFIKEDMPELNKFFHYRSMDVSTVKELARRINPNSYNSAPTKLFKHTALADTMESVEEMQHYIKTFLMEAKYT